MDVGLSPFGRHGVAVTWARRAVSCLELRLTEPAQALGPPCRGRLLPPLQSVWLLSPGLQLVSDGGWLTCPLLPRCAGNIAERSGGPLAGRPGLQGPHYFGAGPPAELATSRAVRRGLAPGTLLLLAPLLLIRPLLITDLISPLGSQARP